MKSKDVFYFLNIFLIFIIMAELLVVSSNCPKYIKLKKNLSYSFSFLIFFQLFTGERPYRHAEPDSLLIKFIWNKDEI